MGDITKAIRATKETKDSTRATKDTTRGIKGTVGITKATRGISTREIVDTAIRATRVITTSRIKATTILVKAIPEVKDEGCPSHSCNEFEDKVWITTGDEGSPQINTSSTASHFCKAGSDRR